MAHRLSLTRAALNRYNTTKVQEVGYNGASAIWQSGTFSSSPHPPYQLIMQSVRPEPRDGYVLLVMLHARATCVDRFHDGTTPGLGKLLI